jgi:hypothetical protein
VDIELADLPRKAAAHPAVPVFFVVGCLLLGAAAWWLAPRRGWVRGPAVLAGCGLALALAVTVVRPAGHFSAAGLDPFSALQECVAGSLSLARTYEKLNVVMLLPFAFFATLATRRPVLVAASCLLVSGFVEYVQAATGGGTCQGRDLVHNIIGGVLGAVLSVVLLGRQTRRSEPITAGRPAGPGSSR